MCRPETREHITNPARVDTHLQICQSIVSHNKLAVILSRLYCDASESQMLRKLSEDETKSDTAEENADISNVILKTHLWMKFLLYINKVRASALSLKDELR